VVHRLAQQAAWGTRELEEILRDLDEVWPRLRFEARWMEAAEKEQMRRALTRFHAWNETNPDELLGVEVNFEAPIVVKDVPCGNVAIGVPARPLPKPEKDTRDRDLIVDPNYFFEEPALYI